MPIPNSALPLGSTANAVETPALVPGLDLRPTNAFALPLAGSHAMHLRLGVLERFQAGGLHMNFGTQWLVRERTYHSGGAILYLFCGRNNPYEVLVGHQVLPWETPSLRGDGYPNTSDARSCRTVVIHGNPTKPPTLAPARAGRRRCRICCAYTPGVMGSDRSTKARRTLAECRLGPSRWMPVVWSQKFTTTCTSPTTPAALRTTQERTHGAPWTQPSCMKNRLPCMTIIGVHGVDNAEHGPSMR